MAKCIWQPIGTVEEAAMSLLDSMMDHCHLMDKTTVNNGLLGRKDVYVPGAAFQATIIKDSSMEARLAEKQGVTEVYTIVAQKGFGLAFHDVVQRDKDGAIFRVTSNQIDSEAPDASTVKIGKVTAERWELPAE